MATSESYCWGGLAGRSQGEFHGRGRNSLGSVPGLANGSRTWWRTLSASQKHRGQRGENFKVSFPTIQQANRLPLPMSLQRMRRQVEWRPSRQKTAMVYTSRVQLLPYRYPGTSSSEVDGHTAGGVWRRTWARSQQRGEERWRRWRRQGGAREERRYSWRIQRSQCHSSSRLTSKAQKSKSQDGERRNRGFRRPVSWKQLRVKQLGLFLVDEFLGTMRQRGRESRRRREGGASWDTPPQTSWKREYYERLGEDSEGTGQSSDDGGENTRPQREQSYPAGAFGGSEEWQRLWRSRDNPAAGPEGNKPGSQREGRDAEGRQEAEEGQEEEEEEELAFTQFKQWRKEEEEKEGEEGQQEGCQEEEEKQEEESLGEWTDSELQRLLDQQFRRDSRGGVRFGDGGTLEEEGEGESWKCPQPAYRPCEITVGAGCTGTSSWTGPIFDAGRSQAFDLPEPDDQAPLRKPPEGDEGTSCIGAGNRYITLRGTRSVRRHPSRSLHSDSPELDRCQLAGGKALGGRAHERRKRVIRKPAPKSKTAPKTRLKVSRMGRLWERKRKRSKSRNMEQLGNRERELEAGKREREEQEGGQERQKFQRRRWFSEGPGVEGEPRQAGNVEERGEFHQPAPASAWRVDPGFLEGVQEQGLRLWETAIGRATNLELAGCLMAWFAIQSAAAEGTENSMRIFHTMFEKFGEPHGPYRRARGAVFPLRAGKLEVLRSMMLASSLEEVCSEGFVATWAEDAWMFCTFTALNAMVLCSQPLPGGAWTAVEERAADSVRGSVRRFLNLKGEGSWTVSKISADLKEKRVSYTGEEIEKVHPLTLEQVVPALPPPGHGGSVKLVDLVSAGTRELLENPERLLKDVTLDNLPKLQGKVHCGDPEVLPLARELVARNICCWTKWEDVHEVAGQKALSGLFGVAKPSTLKDGRPILRLIMNLVPCNSILHTIQGRIKGLPSITSWLSLTTEGSEEVAFWQSDMCSAFYLFLLPSKWAKYLSFNVRVRGDSIGKDPLCYYALSCQVLPMGWSSSVSLMQEAAEYLAWCARLPEAGQVQRGSAIPRFLVDCMAEGDEKMLPWWHCYLDNFCVGQRVKKGRHPKEGNDLHLRAEAAWEANGILSSEKKRVAQASRVEELGALVEGSSQSISISGGRFLKLLVATWYVIGQPRLQVKTLQILAGRWIHALQFRRAAMCQLERIWLMISQKVHGPQLPFQVRRELMGLCWMAPLLQTFLGSRISSVMTASDASERGGAVGISRKLTEAGSDFVRASAIGLQPREKIAVLVISLFNGIGGAFRVYDILGLQPIGGIAFDTYGPAERVTSRRWPYVKHYKDVKIIDDELCNTWAMEFCEIDEIHFWAGFPCTDLSSAKAYREGLSGSASSLFFVIPDVLTKLRRAFGRRVIIKKVVENVSSMDRQECNTISHHLGLQPYHLDQVDASPMRRPRLCWCSEELEDCMEGIQVEVEGCWRKVTAKSPYVRSEQWLEEGCYWPGEADGHVFPTAMKSIPRVRPPPKPAGYSRCDEDCLARWQADDFRYPPYQYGAQFVIWTPSHRWRLLKPDEKELLLGYGWQHTELSCSASTIKRSPKNYEDIRNSLLGDSFSIYSFVIPGVALCKKFLPRLSYRHLCLRMGMSPGFRAGLRMVAEVRRGLNYGTLSVEGARESPQSLNRFLLRRVNHTGSDVRVTTGEILCPRAYPRQSVDPAWWEWQILFHTLWQKQEHINCLEMRSILLAVKFYIFHLKESNVRLFHVTDSYVSMSIIGKGRTSSKKIGWVLRQLNALLLLFNLYLIVGHVESTRNPTDGASRA